MNAVEIEEAISELASQPFDSEEFAYEFLEAFGNKPTTIKRLRKKDSNKSKIKGGVLQRNNIHIAVCEAGEVSNTLNQLRESPQTTKAKAKLILATDGKEFQAEDINSGETVACEYADFHNYFGFFLPLAGISTVKQIRENAFDIKATGRLNKLYIELLRHNPEWATVERRQDMNHFLARLIFCFFAEDTNIFAGDDLFTNTVQQMSMRDASDTHEIISEIFRAMDTKKKDRKKDKIKTWANKFPYVNGALFSGSTEAPTFTKIARSYLIHVGNLDWKQINPDIFGSMIQAVADEDERGALGMHYTSVPNILKVLNPLFLDDLRTSLEDAAENARKLLNLRKRISRIRVFDPACGSGNFLVIAYKEMRLIENEINNRRGESDLSSEIPLTNFRGIELRDFSVEIARLALIIAEFQCDVLYLGQQLALAEFLPLDAENWITKGNALRIDWLSVCPATGTGVKLYGDDLFSTPIDQAEIDFKNEGGETYICGNPPYLGSKWQSKEQKAELETIFEKYTNKWKSLDYVSGWFMKAVKFGLHTSCAAAFVSTNSICQGQQVPILWPIIFNNGFEISFAHTSFKWKNLASYNAGVIVVIVGFAKNVGRNKRLFSLDENFNYTEKKTENINAYLVASKNAEIDQMRTPLSEVAPMLFGNMPRDGGHFILTANQRAEALKEYPEIEKFIRPYLGSEQMIRGKSRWCIWISDDQKDFAEKHPFLSIVINNVSRFRMESKAKSTQDFAKKAYRFVQIAGTAKGHSLAVAKVSSERRRYIPVNLLKSDAILSDLLFALYDAPLWNLSIIASRLHIVWIATVCGKLKTDFRYSNTLGWNTFPLPQLTAKNKADLTTSAEEILIARERHFPATIANLYDPENMPEDLVRAHDRNDEILERIYIGRRFKNNSERLEMLFSLYNKQKK